MNRLFSIIIFALALSASSSQPATQCDSPRCDGNWFNILQPSSDNTKFYQCTPYGIELMPCALGTVFGYNEQVCVWPRDWVDPCGPSTPSEQCDNPRCDGKWNDILQPSSDNTKFYQCTPYGYELMPCAPGTLFGYKEQVCVWPHDWVDPCGPSAPSVTPTQQPTTQSPPPTTPSTTQQPTTQPPPPTTPSTTQQPTTQPPPSSSCDSPRCDGKWFKILQPSHDSSKFFQCTPYGFELMPCAEGTLFGYSEQVCVWPRDWVDSCGPSSPSTICDNPRCDGKWNDILQPSSDNTKFYQCTPYGVELMPCAPGTVFGFKEQVCVWPRDWVDPCGSSTPAPQPTTQPPPPTTPSTTQQPTTQPPPPTTPSTTQQPTTQPPPSSSCDSPRCDGQWFNILQPSHDSSKFFQCTPYGFELMPCAEGTLFGYKEQVCVWPRDWVDSCGPSTPSTTCDNPRCDGEWFNVLQPSSDNTKFYQCTPYGIELMPCAPGTVFGFDQQVCVWPHDWINAC